MEKSRPQLPDNRNYEYSLNEAYRLATGSLRAAAIQEVCQRSGCEYSASDKTITLKYLNQLCHIKLPEIEFTGIELPLRERLIILHYLSWSKGSPLTNRLISLKELPEARNYLRTYTKRTLQPLADNFGKKPLKLIEIASRIDGERADLGDASVRINAIPRVPLTIVLWRGDNELPPQSNILFDETVSDYLPTEDIIVLSETVVWKLVRLAK
ncbi:MAG: DUF3786 domain-containing protein [Chloroflexota bacterium]